MASNNVFFEFIKCLFCERGHQQQWFLDKQRPHMFFRLYFISQCRKDQDTARYELKRDGQSDFYKQKILFGWVIFRVIIGVPN